MTVRSLIVALLVAVASPVVAQEDAAVSDAPTDSPPADVLTSTQRLTSDLPGPDAVDNQLREDREAKPNLFNANLLEPWEKLKEDVYDKTGLRFGGDYSAMYLYASDTLDEQHAAGGILRLYGSWDLVDRGGANAGGLIYKVEHRHSYTDVAPTGLASEVGYVGLLTSVFSDQGWRLTNLYWRQRFFDGRMTVTAGYLDVTDYVDVYALASPWTGFNNLVFSTGSGSIGLPNDATLGIAAGGYITDNVYAIAGLTDANADPTKPLEAFDTFFNDFETFKSIEVGWTSSRDELLLNNVHATFWHVDERDEAGVPDGWGVNGSASVWIDEKWLPFLRGGYAEDGGSLLEWSVSAGFGYQPQRGGNVLGVGVNYGKPNSNTFGADLDEQLTAEVFYRWQVTNNIAVTPDLQVLGNPALNADDDWIAVLGVRARATF